MGRRDPVNAEIAEVRQELRVQNPIPTAGRRWLASGKPGIAPWAIGEGREHWRHGFSVSPFGLQPQAFPAGLVNRQQRGRTQGCLRIGEVADKGPGTGRMDTNAQCRNPGVTDRVFAHARFQPTYAGIGKSSPCS